MNIMDNLNINTPRPWTLSESRQGSAHRWNIIGPDDMTIVAHCDNKGDAVLILTAIEHWDAGIKELNQSIHEATGR